MSMQKKIYSLLVGLALFGVQMAWAANVVEEVTATKLGEDVVLKLRMRDAPASVSRGSVVTNPPRLFFDFADTQKSDSLVALQRLSIGDLTSVNLVQSEGKLRLVLNLVRSLNHDVRVDGKDVLVTLKPIVGAGSTVGSGDKSFQDSTRGGAAKQAVRDISFRRGKDGEGRVILEFSGSGVAVDVKQQGSAVVIDIPGATLPEHLRRKLDVVDFATPVTSVVAASGNDGVKVTITPKGLWEHNAYQTDQQLVVEVKPVIEDPNKLAQGSRLGYQGPLVSINYANGDVRALLRLMAEELGLDAVISETVSGSLTLVLKDVPADQVMDIIFRQKGLDMRKTGKVILIAPREELSLKDKLEFEARQQISELEPLRMESIQLNYQKAVDLARLLAGIGGAGVAPGSQRMLTKRGSVTADGITNTIFISDIPSKLEELRRFIKQIDVGSRQVLIEARVVEANDNFNKDLGVKMNFLTTRRDMIGNSGVAVGGGIHSPPSGTLAWDGTGTTSAQQNFNQLAGVNLPSYSSQGGRFALSLFNASLTRLLNLELAALESDGKGKVISSPKVVTANNVSATIEDGVEVPVVTPGTANSPATVTFKPAKIMLKTTPQITPEGRVRMKLEIAKEEPDWTRSVLGIPPIKSSKVDTDVVVENGGTVVIGGVFTVSNTQTTERVPFFGDLPYVGFLFKMNSTDSTRRELLVFITPRVIDEQMELR